MVNTVVSKLNNRYLIAAVTGLFALSIVRSFARR